MRWLVGWSSTAAGLSHAGDHGLSASGSADRAVHPVGAQLLWGDPDPLWAVGDWRPDEVRVVQADPFTRLAVFGCCGATDEELRVGLFAARGGALRHLTAWSGSYTAVAQVGRRITVAGDLAGARPVFHTPWAGGTAYATAALPLADLIEAQLDVGHLAALLACPDAPEALGDGTPYMGVRRVPPGHALILRGSAPMPGTPAANGSGSSAYSSASSSSASASGPGGSAGAYGSSGDPSPGYGSQAGPGSGSGAYAPGGFGHSGADDPYRDGGSAYGGNGGGRRNSGGGREIVGYEPTASLAVAASQLAPDEAVDRVRDALIEAVRTRLSAPRHAPESDPGGLDPGPVPGMGPAERRAARAGGPAPGIGADLSGGSASATLALLAAGLPGNPGTLLGQGMEAGERLLAVTFNDLATGGGPAADDGPGDAQGDREAELERARSIASNPRLHHVVVAAGEEALPYADLESGPLTDEPGPSLVIAERHRRRLSAGSADHLVGHGARQVLDAHPARLADLLMDRQRRHLLRPMAALAKADGPSGNSLFVPFTVYRAARKLARTPYGAGIADAANRLLERRFDDGADGIGVGDEDVDGPGGGFGEEAWNGHGGAVNGSSGSRRSRGGGAVNASLAALSWCRPGPAARWLTGEALAEVSVRLHEAAGRPATAEPPGERRARAALARHAADHRIFEQAVEVRSQRLHAPFLDNQVVRACRALPEALRVQPGARAQVLRAVLAGAGVRELPPGWGVTSQASQTAAVRAGLRQSIGQLVSLFDAPLLADAGLIEARVVRQALRAAAEGAALPLDGLAELVSTEIWLRRLLARRGTCWTGSSAPRQRAVAGGVIPRPSL
ncbi:asparagine synthase-related protein [Streptomyces sp. H27-D2]|uniref:asparagine synthase-related protein n=1 Tax=Streptomyces sp. H27-D2 TaxID=3046304 RepID=UPI002DBE82AE|nr:asparagine synthase-related protein [Streptomyces sp. H27-D2]MEC4018114.1 asparagine synthase-related protein [Streptomyces sp. H27-D2]